MLMVLLHALFMCNWHSFGDSSLRQLTILALSSFACYFRIMRSLCSSRSRLKPSIQFTLLCHPFSYASQGVILTIFFTPNESLNMASLPSPSKFKQSPTLDADHPFFRAWALRTSKRESSDDVSPGSSPTPSGMAMGQRKGKRGELERFGSEAASSPLLYLIERTSSPSIQDAPSEALSKEEPRPCKTKESVGSAVSGRTGSTASSGIGDCTRKLLRLSEIRRSRTASRESQPTQEARPGHRWYRELSGRWTEIKNGRKQHLEGDLPSPSIGDPRESLEISASNQRSSALTTNSHSILEVVDNKTTKNAVSLHLKKEINSAAPEARANLTEKLGFYFRTRGRWRPKKPVSTKAPRPSDESLSTTEHVLNRASSLLRDLAAKRPLHQVARPVPIYLSRVPSINGPDSCGEIRIVQARALVYAFS